jgi:DNA-binding LytR/AlgR family response regulator
MVTAIAIDDEPIALHIVKNLAARVHFLEIKAFFTNAFEAADFLRNENIDLIFLDINMPDISGIDFLKSIIAPPMVIFTTAYSDHAVQSFELDAVDYLLKPFSFSRFLKACNKANEQIFFRKNASASPEPTSIFIKSGYGQIRVGLDNILYAESNGNYVQFVLEKQKILSRLTMAEASQLLPATIFTRIHRSYIVSKMHITKIEKRSVWIKQAELPVGNAYIRETEKLIL